MYWEAERRGRDRPDKPEYKVKLSVALCFSNKTALCEYYHNSSFLEHGGSPEKATRSAMVSAIDKYLRDNNKYVKGEAKITFPDVQDCLILVSSSFSTQTSYENQTKKAITNKFIQEAMTEFLRSRLEIYFIENRDAAEKIAAQVLINKRSRETAESTRINQKKSLPRRSTLPTGCRSSWTAAPRTWSAARYTSWRATPPWAPASSPATRNFRVSCPSAARSSTA